MSWMRKLLFPLAAIYFLVTLSRNWLYKFKIFSSSSYDFPLICVGNLNTGGTGKSPMTEYCIRLLLEHYKTTVLSRGYGRKTKGYLEVISSKSAAEVGDEPLQFAKKFPDTRVVVCEDRRKGIARIIRDQGVPEVLILDDAFQHRAVEAGLYILLTAYGDLFVDDYVLPAGNLREPRQGSKRADVIVVTKCPSKLSLKEQQEITDHIGAARHQQVFFATIKYSDMLLGGSSIPLKDVIGNQCRVLTGIANPSPLLDHLKSEGLTFDHKAFGDHHNFTENEIQQLDVEGIILTTEKDYVRLEGRLKKARLYYLPIETQFISDGPAFDQKIKEFVAAFN